MYSDGQVQRLPEARPVEEPTVVYVSIIPGTDIFQVRSLVEDPLIIAYSRLVIQIAVTLFMIQIIWLVLVLLASNSPDSSGFIVNFIISVSISLFIVFCAITGVQKKNPVCCCGFGYLDFYHSWCIIGGIFSVIYIIVGIVVGSLFSIIFNSIYLMLYILGENRTRILLRLLSLYDENASENARTRIQQGNESNLSTSLI